MHAGVQELLKVVTQSGTSAGQTAAGYEAEESNASEEEEDEEDDASSDESSESDEAEVAVATPQQAQVDFDLRAHNLILYKGSDCNGLLPSNLTQICLYDGCSEVMVVHQAHNWQRFTLEVSR